MRLLNVYQAFNANIKQKVEKKKFKFNTFLQGLFHVCFTSKADFWELWKLVDNGFFGKF